MKKLNLGGLFRWERLLITNLKMKLTSLLLIVSLFQIQASTYSQNTRITLKLKNATVEEIFDQIESLSEFRFLYNHAKVDVDRRVTINADEERIFDILETLFSNTNIYFTVKKKRISLKTGKIRAPEKTKTNLNDWQDQAITGQVVDEDGQPLPGATVIEKGTNNGTQTDFDGNYSINVSNTSGTLVFSYIGYETKEIPISGQSTINISLAEDTQVLGEVVVTSLGITREKRAIGYATSTIKADEIVKTGTPNVATALYGKAPGVRIAATSGGSTSAVNIQIRGIGSITGSTQPLIVLDGIPIRNNDVSNDNYWADQRVRGNGLLDINPEDVANISILKGASAAALYGNEALNGVVLITTKTGKGGEKGLGVSVNSTYTTDKVAYLPRFQNVRGPGYPVYLNDAGQGEDMWLERDGNRIPIGTTLNYGPKFDGQPALAWTGDVIPYNAQNGPEGLYQDAHNFINNISIVNSTEKSNLRFSYTRQDNEGLSRNSENDKNIFNLNTSFQWNDDLKTDILVNYINAKVKSRPYSIDRLTNNFGGMMTRFDSGNWYQEYYKTSLGYRYVTGDNTNTFTPEENLRIPGYRNDVLDYTWRVNENRYEENTDRVIASITQHWNITDELSLRGRISTDFTSYQSQSKNTSTRPLIYGPSGHYGIENSISKIFYGDVLLTYAKELTPNLGMSLMAGYNATKETFFRTNRGVNGGLSVENWFSLNASTNTANSGSDEEALTKDAFLATANFDYKGYLYLEGTIRRDRTSTMHPDDNAFYYPSVNSGFVFSDAFDMPEFLSYGKLRASWGKVGNFPGRYAANVAYDQNTLGSQGGGSVIYTTTPGTAGNDGIKSETQREIEFGLDLKFLQGRIGLDMAYYDSRLEDQIIPLSLPNSSGASSILTNIGTMRNKGFEVGLNVTPISTADFTWDMNINFAKNENKVESLAPGLEELLHRDFDGGGAQLRSEPGSPVGVFYTHPVATDASGNKIVDPNGLYKVDPDEWVKVGSAQPKAVGGVSNYFRYKNFSLSGLVDYRIGGYVMPTAINWMTGRGLTEESLWAMDAENGGLSWYVDANTGDRNLTNAGTAQGPNGEVVYDNGIVLDGVKADGSTNDYITSNPEYFWTVYNWGGPQYSPNTRYELYIKENTYFKMRELSLGYQLPKEVANKIGFQDIQLSVFGRNLFYLYRNIKDMDAEQLTAGSRWAQNVSNAGTNPASRTLGLSVRAKL
ncbi:SusC/RagA family TonB-linked outer membrane protein [Flagellimonas pacifica]|uniref:TonB-linked outer membrane protein, SusC/RagA family n=1 Tax=Flagellimonas pacifica TaxID=1247520 RepID=A0A285MTE8_9FLAO|nr:SusC/RagA family TonB-linked outer membrane protein [Allomuricauda parva]SNZ00470.1 TonB-linked outer membrane protein, SusC/RagA family [Allomuricauda parva]